MTAIYTSKVCEPLSESWRTVRNILKEKVNQDKSQVGSPTKFKFLGFSLYRMNKKMGIRPHAKSINRFKEKIRELTSRKQGKPIRVILANLKKYTTGWLGYYSLADMKTLIGELNQWIRRRLRQILWKQWKRIRTRCDNLVKLGVTKDQAWQWVNTRLEYWRVAQSWILTTSLTNKYLASIGYDDILKRYEVLRSSH